MVVTPAIVDNWWFGVFYYLLMTPSIIDLILLTAFSVSQITTGWIVMIQILAVVVVV